MKVKNSIKKVGAVAGSALMVGLTMGSAATLADYPQPFVDGDGNVASQIVVGSNGKVADVVGAVNVAASLGQSAVQTEERTAGGGASFGWSATDGQTLDTRNDNLYFGQDIDTVRSTLTAEHLDMLADTTFQDDAGTQTDIEYFLYPGQQGVQFTQPDNDQDPMLNVNNPAAVSASDHLVHLQANFEDDIAFNSSDVEGEEIELFGKTYTVGSDTDGSDLVLLGSQEELSLESGESGTITLAGTDHNVEVVAVTSGSTAAFRIDGTLYEKDEEETVNIDGESVRIDNVIQTSNQNSEGLVTFSVGSEEITITGSGDNVQDDNGDDIEGTFASVQGSVDAASGIDVYLGSEDDDMTYVSAGDTWSHSLFENLEFHFGGLNPDASEDGASVGTVEVSTAGDDTAVVDWTGSGGDSASQEFAYRTSGSFDNGDLQTSDNDAIHVMENASLTEDSYFASDAGDFTHLWQVTDIDTDASSDGAVQEATVDLKDVVTGASVTADLDETSGSSDIYEASEIIDGQDYYFRIDTNPYSSGTEVKVTWGTGAAANEVGMHKSVFTPVDTDSGAGLAFYTNVTGEAVGSAGSFQAYQFPTAETTDRLVANLSHTAYGSNNQLLVDVGDDDTYEANITDDGSTANVDIGGLTYQFKHTGTGTFDLGLYDGSNPVRVPGVAVIEPEDEEGDEGAYVVSVSRSNDETNVDNFDVTPSTHSTQTLDSNNEVTAGYDLFGAYTEYDSGDQGMASIMLPDGQAVAGAAFTDQGGSLDAGGSGGSVTYEALTGMGALPDMARLDSEVTESVRSNNHLILVGGPAVNSLVSTLNDEGSVDLSEVADAQSGAVLQVVNDAFASGQHAMVVAGYGASDTRSAARYLSNYADHEQALSDAGERLVLTEADYPSSQ